MLFRSVAYGIKGDMVAYTVNYQDAAGNALLESDTYYGNPGERQYVSSRYVDGYVPQALNLVKTLSVNEAENVFTFISERPDLPPRGRIFHTGRLLDPGKPGAAMRPAQGGIHYSPGNRYGGYP